MRGNPEWTITDMPAGTYVLSERAIRQIQLKINCLFNLPHDVVDKSSSPTSVVKSQALSRLFVAVERWLKSFESESAINILQSLPICCLQLSFWCKRTWDTREDCPAHSESLACGDQEQWA